MTPLLLALSSAMVAIVRPVSGDKWLAYPACGETKAEESLLLYSYFDNPSFVQANERSSFFAAERLPLEARIFQRSLDAHADAQESKLYLNDWFQILSFVH
ncbi:hypothetical protein [Microvirga flavescens]|uniref:hypothetical protein n=1 Tax=Microvirga flavescens TaxID=2249811 RepID=UPI000DD53822|nr:hypothetical protein [Microvirga flavescens]